MDKLDGESLNKENEDKERNKFGQIIREARKKRDIGLREFARQVEIDYSRLSRIERGERPPPDLELVLRMSDLLEIDKNELLRLAGVPKEVISNVEDENIENWIPGRVCGKKGKLTLIKSGEWKIKIVKEPEKKHISLGLRPEDITLFVSNNSFSDTSARNQLKGAIKEIVPKKNYNWIKLDCGNFDLTVAITDTSLCNLNLYPSKVVFATFKATAPKIKGRPKS